MHWMAEHWQENAIALVLALVFAVVFAIIADAMSIGSRARERFRWLLNRQAERSLDRLRVRIGELEHRRKMLASRTAILLLGLQNALRTLFITSLGFSFAVLRAVDLPTVVNSTAAVLGNILHVAPEKLTLSTPRLDNMLRAEITLSCLLFFVLGAASALAGLNLTRVDREDRLAKAMGQLDDEITVLKSKENALLQRKAENPSSRQ